MDATLNRSENRFATIANLLELVNTLRVKISRISNVNHGSTIPMPTEEVESQKKKLCT